MTADVTQDRRVTVPTRGTHTVAVDGARLFRALPPHPVHEGLGYRGFPQQGCSRTGYKVMRVFPHASFTAQSRITISCRWLDYRSRPTASAVLGAAVGF